MPPRRHLLAATAIAGAAALLVVSFGHGRDQAIYAAVARVILDGGAPYRDAFDFKPPGIHLTFAASMLVWGDTERAIRVTEGLALVVTGLLLVDLSHRWWRAPGVGVLATALAALTHAQLDFWHTAQPESFGGLLTLAGLRAAWRGKRASNVALFACGVCFGLAGAMKPPLAAGAFLVAVWASEPGRRARPWVLVLAGLAAPWVVIVAWLERSGGLAAALEIFTVVAPGYTALGWRDTGPFELLVRSTTGWLGATSGGIILGIALCGLGIRFVRARRASGLLAAMCLVQLAGVAAQAKLFAYHYGALGPAAALLAGLGWWWAWRRLSRPAVSAALAASCVAFTATPHDLEAGFWRRSARRLALAGSSSAAWDDLATVAGVSPRALRRVAEVLHEGTEEGATIFVWGFEPAIYGLSQRRPASPYLYDVPQRLAASAPRARSRLMDGLERSPPGAIGVEHGDVMPWVTGDALDSAAALDTFPRLQRFLDERYGAPTAVENFDIYLLDPTRVR